MGTPSVGRRAFSLLELLVVIAIAALLAGLSLAAIQRAREAASRAQCVNNLRQIGLALHNYHDGYKVFPPGVSVNIDNGSRPLAGWQVYILPYIEQEALWRITLEAFHQDKVFFHNPPHVGFATVQPLYSCPSDGRVRSTQRTTISDFDVAFTSYLGVLGESLVKTNGILFLDSAVRLSDVTDGASNTVLVGERPPSADLEWGWWYAGVGQMRTGSGDMVLGVRELFASYAPGSFCPPGPYHFVAGRVDNQCDTYHFWSLHPGGANFLFADGAVRFLTYNNDDVMLALGTRNGGEAFDLP
jgi:prepilin-type N-terminal cleavage/methylation domain-containing protein/prepilin-type processing-associated H-X9-DG protein